MPDELQVTARTGDGVVMAIAHRHLPVVGLQFHPESILTEHGYELLAAFLTSASLRVPDRRPAIADERSQSATRPLPTAPVTF